MASAGRAYRAPLTLVVMPHECDMKAMTTIEELVDEVSPRLRKGDVRFIGIDGKDGSGKSYLARLLSDKATLALISLDNYVEKKKGEYVAHLDFSAIKERLESLSSPVIIEGVCLLDVLERLGVELDIHIYVKRMSSYGDWRDDEECDLSISPAEYIAQRAEELDKLSRLEAALHENNSAEAGLEEVRLPELIKEQIHYHAKYRPFDRADYIFERAEA